ncbi:hypothetical protein [Roseovarius sp. MMSF_3305]|uniref:hypothetical protein n=1 Tax=Roseovarius sp. MMSF_3305 TaxID=3046697 RepID=UPI00273D4C88|nr:hypothetical protein [Roseovarius sp. MMSF_3305]
MGNAHIEFIFHLNGRFRIETSGGEEIVLSSAKACGLLALLATEETLTRHRIWLQDKLWSDRRAEQGAGSLRQVLVQIRRAFGAASDILSADRTVVRLDPSRIEIKRDGKGEFLEGIDIRDPEFNTWLASMRSGQPVVAAAAHPVSFDRPRKRRELIIEPFNQPDSTLGVLEARFGDILHRSLREVVEFAPAQSTNAIPQPGTLVLAVQAFEAGDGYTGLRASIYEGQSAGPHWADSALGQAPVGNGEFGLEYLNLCHKICDTLSELLCRPVVGSPDELDANFLVGRGLRQMFSMRRDGLEAAGHLFDRAYEINPRGLYLAWKSQLAVIDFVESGGQRREELRALADESCARAIADEPTNSVVLAASANARLVLDNDAQAACDLSRLGVHANPSNPLAWWAWSNALLYSGNSNKSHQAARTAQHLSRQGSFRYWADFQVALTSAIVGDLDSAIKNAQRARALCPSFRPPLRYLIGFLSSRGDLEQSNEIFQRLKKIEPEITIDKFLNDDTYPISMLRKAKLVNKDLLRSS